MDIVLIIIIMHGESKNVYDESQETSKSAPSVQYLLCSRCQHMTGLCF
jgi:hypothetical protein